MVNFISRNLLKFLSIAWLLSILSCNSSPSETLTIATAANMQFAMKAITSEFTTTTGIPCHVVLSSSGKLTAQIKEGAPYHVFVSANMKYPNDLFKNGFTASKPTIYAHGKLVLWTKNSIHPSLSVLTSNDIKFIALANPKTAPYGEAALEVIKHYNLFDSIQHKLVYGESIAQTNQFIDTRAADIGFTAKSIVMALAEEKRGHWQPISDTAYSPIAQGVVLLNATPDMAIASKEFYNFLLSDKAKQILNTFGYD